MQNCPHCKRLEKMVVLVCSHKLCVNCAGETVKRQPQQEKELRVKLICKVCKRPTVTYSINNLILGCEESLKLLNQRCEVAQTRTYERSGSRNQKRKTPDSKTARPVKKKRSSSKVEEELRCPKHNMEFIYYSTQKKRLLCHQCQPSSLCIPLSQSAPLLQQDAQLLRAQSSQKVKDLKLNLKILERNSQQLSKNKQACLQRIKLQFEVIHDLAKKRQNYLTKLVTNFYSSKNVLLEQQFKDMSVLKTWLQSQPLAFQGNKAAHFIYQFGVIKKTLAKYSINQRQFQEQNLIALDSTVSLPELKRVIQNFLQLKQEREQIQDWQTGWDEPVEIKRPESQMNNYQSKLKQIKNKPKPTPSHRKNSLR